MLTGVYTTSKHFWIFVAKLECRHLTLFYGGEKHSVSSVPNVEKDCHPVDSSLKDVKALLHWSQRCMCGPPMRPCPSYPCLIPSLIFQWLTKIWVWRGQFLFPLSSTRRLLNWRVFLDFLVSSVPILRLTFTASVVCSQLLFAGWKLLLAELDLRQKVLVSSNNSTCHLLSQWKQRT